MLRYHIHKQINMYNYVIPLFASGVENIYLKEQKEKTKIFYN